MIQQMARPAGIRLVMLMNQKPFTKHLFEKITLFEACPGICWYTIGL